MSEIYEGYVTKASERHIREALVETGTLLRFRLSSIGPYAVADRVAGREVSFSPEVQSLAAILSTLLGSLVTYLYDSRVGNRAGSVFDAGVQKHSFDEADELWVPLAEDGEPMAEAAPLHLSELRDDEEYETSMNAIDLALEQVGVGELNWRTLHDHLSTQGESDES